MALTGIDHPARFANGHHECKILCGRVAIGATGAVTDVDTPGVTVTRVSKGLYRFVINKASGGVNAFMYTDVNMMYAEGIPALASEANNCTVVAVTASSGTVDAKTTRYKNNSTPAELLEEEVQDPESGSFLQYCFIVHDTGATIPD